MEKVEDRVCDDLKQIADHIKDNDRIPDVTWYIIVNYTQKIKKLLNI